MVILAAFPCPDLFTSLPLNPPPSNPNPTPSPSPPIPIPKYPPPLKSTSPPKPHRHYHKPLKDHAISPSSGHAVVIGESGVSYLLPGAPFEFQFSYSETPKVKPLAIRQPEFLPFTAPAPPIPWTGKKSPVRKPEKKIRLLEPLNSRLPESEGAKLMQMTRAVLGTYSSDGRSREEILGEPLEKTEIRELIKPILSTNHQVNLGRDGLTHNMLELIHLHWRRHPVCKVKCIGVPTVDMNNVCYHLEEKTGGKIIHRFGGVVYVFRGRNYDHRTRPRFPVMRWKPAVPVYPKLIQEVPEGLTKDEAEKLRMKGKMLLPICKLAKNGVYIRLVREVQNAFEESPLAKIDCKALRANDYKKIGVKLKDLVPCVLLSFDDEQILMWRGHNWKSMYPEPEAPSAMVPHDSDAVEDSDSSGHLDRKAKMVSLWRRALESRVALLLDEISISADLLLKKVEEFEDSSQGR